MPFSLSLCSFNVIITHILAVLTVLLIPVSNKDLLTHLLSEDLTPYYVLFNGHNHLHIVLASQICQFINSLFLSLWIFFCANYLFLIMTPPVTTWDQRVVFHSVSNNPFPKLLTCLIDCISCAFHISSSTGETPVDTHIEVSSYLVPMLPVFKHSESFYTWIPFPKYSSVLPLYTFFQWFLVCIESTPIGIYLIAQDTLCSDLSYFSTAFAHFISILTLLLPNPINQFFKYTLYFSGLFCHPPHPFYWKALPCNMFKF